jgi:hypothetical protein
LVFISAIESLSVEDLPHAFSTVDSRVLDCLGAEKKIVCTLPSRRQWRVAHLLPVAHSVVNNNSGILSGRAAAK